MSIAARQLYPASARQPYEFVLSIFHCQVHILPIVTMGFLPTLPLKIPPCMRTELDPRKNLSSKHRMLSSMI